MKNGIMQNPTERLTSTKENEHQKENSHVDLPSRKLNGLDLFSGIGGITKALDEWVQPVAYSENERYCQGTLLSRISTGDLPNAPIWDDVRTLTANHLPRVDVVYGGFPCQDISVANTSGTGLAGKRSGLFFEIERLIREIRPRFVFLENVPAIRTRGGSIVGARLADAGYDCRWVTLSASEVGANHQRKRWFLLAKSHGISRGAIKESEKQTGETWRESIGNSSTNVADPDSNREKRDQPEDGGRGGIVKNDWWAIEPNVGRVAYGIPSRMDRLKCLGNSVCPSQAKEAFKILMGI